MSVTELAAPHTTRPLNVYFCAWPVAGVRTQYDNVRSVAALADDLALRYIEIDPYKAGGLIERMPLLGHRTKGSLRSFVCSLPLFWESPIDVIWTQAGTALFPFIATRARYAGIPYAISTDATNTQIERFEEYGLGDPGGRPSLKHRVRDRILAYCYRHAELVLPWSRWAAQAIADEYGVPDERIDVVPPGVDLRQWPARQETAVQRDGPTRLLFVGGDFARKGGPLLLEVFRAHLRDRCELHLVTKDGEADEPGVIVYRDFGPNDPGLRQLYEKCDALVLPTRADCFSLASLEAMASGLPVITCPVGGIPEIVEDGRSGWLVPVGDGAALLAAIEALLAQPEQARAMGWRGRAIAEERFDAAVNTRRVFNRLRRLRGVERS
jgi:glycosyltransferase involved in cell wall biosynthesis